MNTNEVIACNWMKLMSILRDGNVTNNTRITPVIDENKKDIRRNIFHIIFDTVFVRVTICIVWISGIIFVRIFGIIIIIIPFFINF